MSRETINVKRNFLYSFIYQMFAIIIPFITTPYVSRVLGAGGIGQYAYAYSVAYYFAIFIKLGLNNYGNRTISVYRENKGELSKHFWNIYTTQIVLGCFLTLVYILYAFVATHGSAIAYLLTFFVLSYVVDITWFFWGLEEFRLTIIRDVFIKLATTICIFVFVKENTDVWKYTLILSVSIFISQLSLWPLLIKRVSRVRPTWTEVKKHIRPNLVLFIPTIAVSIYKMLDKVMLGAISGKIEVGYYESCEKIVNFPMAIINALGNVMLPHMSNLYSNIESKSMERALEMIRKSEHLATLTSSVLCFGIMSVAQEFVPLFYGKGFEKCIILYKILLPSCVFLAFANVIKTQFIIPKNRDNYYIASVFVGALTNFFVNLLLIPQLASVGAAIGTLLAEAIVCVTMICAVKKEIPILQYMKECLQYVLMGVVMFVASGYIQINFVQGWIALIVKIVICGMVWVASGAIILGIQWWKCRGI